VSPIRWVVKKGKERTYRVKNKTEARAAYAEVPVDQGAVDSLEVLTNWATLWRRKVYGVGPLTMTDDSMTPEEEGGGKAVTAEVAGLLY
jgi:hypothetical protein